jgi:hypothetical protein
VRNLGPKPNCGIALLKPTSAGQYGCGPAEASPPEIGRSGAGSVSVKAAHDTSVAAQSIRREGDAMSQYWRIYLARAVPPGAILDFSATEFALEVAINLRYCLNLVRPTSECIELAELVLLRASNYGEARMGHSPQSFAEAEAALANATRLLEIELEYCANRGTRDSCDQAA